MAKKIKGSFYSLNVKVQPTPKQATYYGTLLLEIFKKDIFITYGTDKAIAFRNMFTKGIIYKNIEYQIIYGKLIRFTIVDPHNWYNRIKKDYIDVTIPEDAFPNGKETDYIFIPAIHRFILKKGGITVNRVSEFLNKALDQVISRKENVITEISTSKDAINKILSSKKLVSLDIDVSYTNDDIGGDAQEVMDDLLKEAGIENFTGKLRTNSDEGLDTTSTFVKGLVELAKDNGDATAKIVNEDNSKETVKTDDYPEIIPVDGEDYEKLIEETAIKYLRKYPRK